MGMRTRWPVPLFFALSAVCPLLGQVSLAGKVVDETGVAVAGARLEFTGPRGGLTTLLSDRSGAFHTEFERSGGYRIRAAREAFFEFHGGVTLGEGANHLTVVLNHLQEFSESVDVTYSPPAIDPQDTSDHEELNNVEILTVPFPAPQDLRSALPLFPGVIQDNSGRLHFNGGGTEQTNFTLDGFNIADPVTGRLEARVNIDSVRSLDLESSRFAPDTGRGSAGSLDIQTKMGDDRWRFSGANFIPGFSSESGFHMNKWTPRLEFSGPLAKGRAWFHNGFEGFYSADVVSGLPSGQNRTTGLTLGDIGRFQVNLTPANILSGSFLFNRARALRSGLTFLDPAETTTNRRQSFYMASIRDQVFFSGGQLAEFGYADSRGLLRQVPQGNQTFEITPFGSRGNYFVNLDRHIYRQEWLSNVYLKPVNWHGAHQFKFGVDFQRSAFHQSVNRHPYQVLRVDNSVARYVTFQGNRFRERANFEGSQYVMDRWNPRDTLLVEAGLRTDWDQIVRNVLWSPRLSAAWSPKALRDTKFAAGAGIFYDALTFATITQQQDQISYSTFFEPGGLVQGPVPTAFLVNEHALRTPRYRTLSLSVERKLPWDFYGKAAATDKVGEHGFTFVDALDSPLEKGALYALRNQRRDHYRSLELSVRRTFAGQFEWFAGYTRSRARANAVVDYSLENPVFGPQAGGPLPWDARDRFLTWGWAPLPKRLLPARLAFLTRNTSAAFLVEYRSGFPFDLVDEDGFMVGPPNSRRFPSYCNINLHFERKFRAMHYLWAWRFGVNNLTNNGNPNSVNNNIDSPYFLTYGRGQLRAVSVRLRLLGKK